MTKRSLVLAVILLFLGSVRAPAVCIQPTIFDAILKTNVDRDGFVNYDAIRVNKGGDLYEFIAFIEDADLKSCTESERLAFWINAYNAHMIRLVLARSNMKQVSEDFKLFGEQFKVAQRNLSLNDIEHRIIRSSAKKGGPIEGVSFKELDPRIHFALVCGALECPRLYNRAYTSATLDATLQAGAVRFANSPKHIRIEDGKLVVSSLMRWYEEDFSKLGGVVNYLTPLIDPKERADAEQIKAALVIDFPQNTLFKYDWTLNSIANRPAAAPVPK